MSDNGKPHGATTIHASKGGGGAGKWLLGAVAAAVIIGGGYYAYKTMSPTGQNTDIAYDEPYGSDSENGVRAGALEDQSAIADTAATDEGAAEPASTTSEARTTTPARRSTAVRTADVVPEETIGITPVSATTESSTDSDEIVVTGQRRPVWAAMPTQRRLSALYPERALSRGREGEASLHCVVQNGGALGCETVSATPGGFGTAAQRVARTFRHSPQLADGSDATGSPVNLRVVFRIADEPRRG